MGPGGGEGWVVAQVEWRSKKKEEVAGSGLPNCHKTFTAK
jgi:hypothetical protein